MRFHRLRDLREDHDLTQKALAKVLNCSLQTYRRYENGIAAIPAEVLILLAEFYHTSIDYLLGRAKNP